MDSTIEPDTGALASQATFPAEVYQQTDDAGFRRLAVRVDMTSIGAERWAYDSVINVMDGVLTILFFDEDQDWREHSGP